MVDPETKLCALLGNPVSHSGSPAMHNAAFQATGRNAKYLAFAVTADQLPAAIRGLLALGAAGANVTVPHKEQALRLADQSTERAQKTGAANVLTFRDGQVIADNTDGIGFVQSLREAGTEIRDRTVVVIGAGGAARAVVWACLDQGARRIFLLNRTVERAQELARVVAPDTEDRDRIQVASLAEPGTALSQGDIIINATSLGLRADDPSPLRDWTAVPDHAVAVDLIYAPHVTAFLAAAQERGLPTVDGQGMLVWQAAYSWQAWFGELGPAGVMAAALQAWLNSR